MLNNHLTLSNQVKDHVVANVKMTRFTSDGRRICKVDSRLIIFINHSGATLLKVKISQKETILHNLLRHLTQSYILRHHGAQRDTRGLRTRVSVNRGTVAPNGEVVTSVAAGIRVHTIRGINMST
jgi:hypothetical protein